MFSGYIFVMQIFS